MFWVIAFWLGIYLFVLSSFKFCPDLCHQKALSGCWTALIFVSSLRRNSWHFVSLPGCRIPALCPTAKTGEVSFSYTNSSLGLKQWSTCRPWPSCPDVCTEEKRKINGPGNMVNPVHPAHSFVFTDTVGLFTLFSWEALQSEFCKCIKIKTLLCEASGWQFICFMWELPFFTDLLVNVHKDKCTAPSTITGITGEDE